ncbi:TPA: hypothetical protein NVD24_002498 [Vibrio cholerae]|nr:hypothetical protein [Vibrio cholerae]ELJ8618223.1 hypothetical protein [Vibrio cholerae]ELJ8741455.1 hypothetical protein [Vibrio cholerae]GHY29119.1 hypothetical protein VCSRO164_2857 [Vibrio cholerae]HCJ6872931.1 hypothetical protein [Vibrio cholerae]
MNAAWHWIKAIGLAALLITILVLGLQLKASQAEQIMLSEKLSQAQAANQSNLTTIATLKGEAAEHNALMVKRQQERNQSEAKLNDDIAKLKAQMAGIECHIPDAVSQRLREPY